MKPNDTRPKRARVKKTLSVQQLEYEETHKRLQEKKKKNRRPKRSIGRKLYSHRNSLDETTEKENAELVDKIPEPRPKKARTSLQSVRSLPYRSAKDISLKYK